MDSGRSARRLQADAPVSGNAAKGPGAVVFYSCKEYDPRGHECITHNEVARRLAAIKHYQFAGEFDPSCRYDCPLYFVPNDTLDAIDMAHRLGIYEEQHLFGGVVPFPFVASKTITHPLAAADAQAPEGWSSGFARRVREAVLPGFSAFTRQDARSAGMRMLRQGPVRVKKASGTGGLGQWVAADADQLEAELQSLDTEELRRSGVVLEQNLSDVATLSVGQVHVGTLRVTYYGTQRLTANNHGEQVYGGSRLVVVRGDFDALLRRDLAPEVRTAVGQACIYHVAALASFPGMFVSRSNYDIAQGRDAEGRWHSGVLEQSWRIGGASGAEVIAIDAFQSDPELDAVCASTTEVYGEYPALPPDAVVYYQGIDEHVGPITKYSRLEFYADAR